MLVVDGLDQLPPALDYPVMAIGVFDGIHAGHQVVLQRLVDRARSQGGISLLLTFAPHPQKVISPSDAPCLLQTRGQKVEFLEQFAIDVMIQLPFTRRLSLYTPEQFAHHILSNCGIREIYVGKTFRFGHGRAGDFGRLGKLGERYGFRVFPLEPVCFRNLPISSTRIRNLLGEGRVALAKRLLNRAYSIQGTVVRGSAKGRELGFPTANLETKNELIPANGVYFTRAWFNRKAHLSVTNIGFRPTLYESSGQKLVMETHLPDFQENLYGKSIRLDFCLRIREEKRFDGLEALKLRIGKDILGARSYARRAFPFLVEETTCH